MTRFLYMDSREAQYLKEFTASVEEVGPGFVVLDQTAFYAEGGGQPSDRGTLAFGGGSAEVARVTKRGPVQHFVAGALPSEGERVEGLVDWELRYRHMRMHTAQHVVSGLVYDEYGSRTVGNQLHAETSRIDFGRDRFTDEEIARIESEVNAILAREIDLEVFTAPRSEVESMVDPLRVNLDLIPKGVSELRVVRIGDVDLCPCAGTHVKNTREIGRIQVTETVSKGAGKTRLVYRLI